MLSPIRKTPEDILIEHGAALVRCAIDRNDEVTDALFEVATSGRTEWTHRDAVRLVSSLKSCDMTIADWLKTRGRKS